MMGKMKERGITLVALVVTIIIILILAGVTISQITGDNGLISRTKQAKVEYETEALKEEIRLAVLDKRLEKNGEISDTDLEGILKKYGTVEGTGKDMVLTPTGKSYKMSYKEIMQDDEINTGISDSESSDSTSVEIAELKDRIKKLENEQLTFYNNSNELKGIGGEVHSFDNRTTFTANNENEFTDVKNKITIPANCYYTVTIFAYADKNIKEVRSTHSGNATNHVSMTNTGSAGKLDSTSCGFASEAFDLYGFVRAEEAAQGTFGFSGFYIQMKD